jgi:hypothetical protein
MSFYGFFKKLNFRSKFIGVLPYDFTENRQFGAKTDRNFIFLYHDHNIVDQLYIIVMYISFFGF